MSLSHPPRRAPAIARATAVLHPILAAALLLLVQACGSRGVRGPGASDPQPLTISAGQGVTATPAASASYARGTIVDYSFVAQSGYAALEVTLDGAAVAASGKVTMDGPHTLAATARSTQPSFDLTVTLGAGVTGAPSASRSYVQGTTVNYAFSTLSGYDSLKVTLDGNPVAASGTISMDASHTIVASAAYANPDVGPVTGHPRLWITQSDLPRLRGWAVASNPVYQRGLLPLLEAALSDYETLYFPGGVASKPWPDEGDFNCYSPRKDVVNHMGVLAFHAMIDPDPVKRLRYAQYARSILMYIADIAAQGHLGGAPYRDPKYAMYNCSHTSSQYFPLTVDWLQDPALVDSQGNPVLSAADKATLRRVFMLWAQDNYNAIVATVRDTTPPLYGNARKLFPNNKADRMAANNYRLGQARALTMLPLAMDAVDDPPLDAAKPVEQLGNSLRSYLLAANGVALYEEYAVYGDPADVKAAYGLPAGADMGIASGGPPLEGSEYGVALGAVLGQLLALKTAGYDNPALSGAQIELIRAPVWDRYLAGELTAITPSAATLAQYMGPVYQKMSFGDQLRSYVTPDNATPMALLALLQQRYGKSSNLDAVRWWIVNALQGGSSTFLTRISDPWAWSTLDSLTTFMVMDPSLAAPADPRPGLPTIFYDRTAGQLFAHSDWSANATMFGYHATPFSLNHVQDNAGLFYLFRNGEWLVRDFASYATVGFGATSLWHNTLSIQNWNSQGAPRLTTAIQQEEWDEGSQFSFDANTGVAGNGDSVTVMSDGQGYVFASSDLTKPYNRPGNPFAANDASMDVLLATRSVLWVDEDYVVVYDRATTVHPGFKRFNLNVQTKPTIVGSVATEVFPSGQQLFVQTLLPAQPSYTYSDPAGFANAVADLEQSRFVLTIQDASNPMDLRFLHVLQGADAGAAMVRATRVSSASGTPFDVAVFGSRAAAFPVVPGPVGATTFVLPAGVTTFVVTGLTAGGTYGVSASGSTVTLSPDGSARADSAGVLKVSL